MLFTHLNLLVSTVAIYPGTCKGEGGFPSYLMIGLGIGKLCRGLQLLGGYFLSGTKR